MKSIKIVFNILSNASAVTALVTADKIVPQRQDTGTEPPYITMRRISSNPWDSDDGIVAYDDLVEVKSFAKLQNDAYDIDAAIIAALDNKLPGTYNACTLILLSHLNSEDFSEDGADTDGLYSVTSNFYVNYGA